MPNKNIYIAALEYGEERLEEGVTFKELIKYLESSHKIEGALLQSFRIWFFQNFYNERTFPGYSIILQTTKSSKNSYREYGNEIRYDGIKCHLMTNGHFQYLEWVELNEARLSAKRAQCIAVFAIIISGVLAASSIVFQILIND